jgi:hypothetical protein
MDVLEPGSANEVATMRRLAVSKFRNDDGGVATAALENALGSVMVGRKQHFTLVNAQSLQEYSEGLDPDLALVGRTGKHAGADGVVLGTVTHSGWHDQITSEQRSVCVARNENGACQKMANRPVRCVRRTGTFSFLPKVVRASTGEIIFSQEFSEVEENTACYDRDGMELAPGYALIASAREQAIRQFVETVAPHFVRIRIPLLVEDGTAMPEKIKASITASIKSGVDEVQAGRVDKACAQWSAAGLNSPTGYALPYLNGVCAEYAGDLEAALEQYRLADRRSPKSVPEIGEALSRVRRTQDNQRKLSQQLQ